MKKQILYRILRTAVLTAGLLSAVSGCVLEEDGNEESPADGRSDYRMYISVVMKSATATRAGHKDDAEEKGTEAENFIDFAEKDFAIVLFDDGGRYLSGVDVNNGEWRITSDNGSVSYHWEGDIVFPDNISDATLENLKTNGFQALAVANWVSAGRLAAPAYGSLFAGESKLEHIWKNRTSYNFVYTPESGNVTWRPNLSESRKKLIPMFGFARASKFERRTSGGPFISTATIPMQRALAKVEVIDNLANQPNLSVDGVTMTSFNTSGRLIPDVEANPGWNVVGEQVNTSSLPSGVSTLTDLKFVHVEEPDKNGISVGKWIAYVPEMYLGVPKTINDRTKIFDGEKETDRPRLNVTIGSKLDFYKGDTYPAHFASYNDNFEPTIPDESWNHILRNHIYRFSVNKVGMSVELHLHVIPWYKDEDEVWDYTDQITIQRILSWVEYPDPDGKTDENGAVLKVPSYESYNPETGDVVLWLDPKRAPLTGSFKITTPINGRWYVRLVHIDGSKTDAVSFVDVDKDGKPIPLPAGASPRLEISGLISNEPFPDYFYILPTNFDNDTESRYRLEFYVENLGTWTEVPMTPDTFRYYTIVRQGNLIVE